MSEQRESLINPHIKTSAGANSMKEIHAKRKMLRDSNRLYGQIPVQIPKEKWPEASVKLRMVPEEVWRSCDFLIQVFHEKEGLIRFSVCRSAIDDKGNWLSDISWDELQFLKDACGYGHCDAVEIYPAQEDVVNVANMRHLWIFRQRLSFAWRKPKPHEQNTTPAKTKVPSITSPDGR